MGSFDQTSAPPRSAAVELALAALRSRATSIAFVIAALCVMLITFRPFGTPDVPGERLSDGDPVNQYGFLIAGGLVAFALATLVDRRLMARILGPAWLAMGAVLVLSIFAAQSPNETMRSVVLTVIAMSVAISVILVPRSERDFRVAFTATAFLVLALAYLSVLALPGLAIHQAGEVESQHAGLWRGHYTHKNIAGPVMSVLVMYGIYAWRSGERASGLLIATAAAFFLVQTGSKTTLGFVPVAIAIVAIRPLFGSAGLAVAAHLCVLAAAFALTLGTVLAEPLADLVAGFAGDVTFTGRTALWDFALSVIAERPWTGHGFYDFWGTSAVLGREHNFEAAWDIRGAVSGHSNFVDMPLIFGYAGAFVVLWAFLLAPLADYVRAARDPENARLADFFMMVVVFMSLVSLMESFLFNRADSFWLLVVMAVFGLRMVARAKVQA